MLERIRKRRENTQEIIDRLLPYTENNELNGQITLIRVLNGLPEEQQIWSEDHEHDHILIDTLLKTIKEIPVNIGKKKIIESLRNAGFKATIQHAITQQNNKTQK